MNLEQEAHDGSLCSFPFLRLGCQPTTDSQYFSKYIYTGGGLVAKSCPTLVTPWTVAHQAPLSMGFSRQEYWSGLPCPPLGDLPDPMTKPGSPAWQVDSLLSQPPGKAKVK